MVRLARVSLSVVLLLSVLGYAAADKQVRSSARCVRYSQKMNGKQSGVDLRLVNRCRFSVSCSLEWQLVCAGQGAGGTELAHFDLERGETGATHASASACDGDWEVSNVRWSCDPDRGR